ncbi:MAG: hypothetical protein JWP99_27 [Devosia sp.]|nr:hypothetical protein [Devosia sp.]
MLGRIGYGLGRAGRRFADTLVTLPVSRWTWRSLADDAYGGDLPEFRPADRDTVRDMMAGRYLLASKLIETGGASPFSLDVDHLDWWLNLHSFSWLRHFRDVRDTGERRFARTLVLDWIGREGGFERESWAIALTAQRVLNWLRHLPLLLEGATPDQARTIQRVIGTQVQSLKVRARLAQEPLDALFAAIAILGAQACEPGDKSDVSAKVERLNQLLASQIDEYGLHLTRSTKTQLQLLCDLLSVRAVAGSSKSEAANELGAQIDRMHETLDALTLSSGEPAYFNGTGHLPHDVLIAIQANSPGRRRRTMLLGGYGILRSGDSVVVMDTGLLPPPGFRGELHRSALALEFSHASQLIFGSCGPAPADLPASKALFRQGVAHSAPTIDADDIPGTAKPLVQLDVADHLLSATSSGLARRFGVELERRVTLLSGGTTLVGQDRMIGRGSPSGLLAARFHLAPGIVVRRNNNEDIVRLVLPGGSIWSFMWEGAEFREDDSVRQSAYVGFHRTRQLVLEAEIAPDREIAWIFTLEQN